MTDLVALCQRLNTSEEYMFGASKDRMKNFCKYQLGRDYVDNPQYMTTFVASTIVLITLYLKLTWLKHVPHSIIVLISGIASGLTFLVIAGPFEKDSMIISPFFLLTAFLPIRVFESAFNVEFEMFKSCTVQIIAISTIGFCVSMVGVGFIADMFLPTFDRKHGLCYGSIISATDPVAVVALLTELGAAKHLRTILEGESLFNDGAAMIAYSVTSKIIYEGGVFEGTDIAMYALKSASVAIVVGCVVGQAQLISLRISSENYPQEIVIWTVAPYVSYITCEALGCSGVMSVAVQGLLMSANKNYMPSHRKLKISGYLEVLTMCANTVIFLEMGFASSRALMENVLMNLQDFVGMMLMYLACILVRLVMFLFLFPLIGHFGGVGFTWKDVILSTWGGLRGAVSLTLAMRLEEQANSDEQSEHDQYPGTVVLHTSFIVIMTCLFNGLTFAPLVRMLDVEDVAAINYSRFHRILDNLRKFKEVSVRQITEDRFFGVVSSAFLLETGEPGNKYANIKARKRLFELQSYHQRLQCQKCDHVTVISPPNEVQLSNSRDASVKVMVLLNQHMWRLFHEGCLSIETITHLNSKCLHHLNHGLEMLTPMDKLFTHGPSETLVTKLRLFCLRSISWILTKFSNCGHKICPIQIELQHHDRHHDSIIVETFICLLMLVTNGQRLLPGFQQSIPSLLIIRTSLILLVVATMNSIIDQFPDSLNVFSAANSLTQFALLIGMAGELVDPFSSLMTATCSMIVFARLVICLLKLDVFESFQESVCSQVKSIEESYRVVRYEANYAYIYAVEQIMHRMSNLSELVKVVSEYRQTCTDNVTAAVINLKTLQSEDPELALAVATKQCIRKLLHLIRTTTYELTLAHLMPTDYHDAVIQTLEDLLPRHVTLPHVYWTIPVDLLGQIPWLADCAEKHLIDIASLAHLQFISWDGIQHAEGGVVKSLEIVKTGTLLQQRLVIIPKLSSKYEYSAWKARRVADDGTSTEAASSDRAVQHEEMITTVTRHAGEVVGNSSCLLGNRYLGTVTAMTNAEVLQLELNSLYEYLDTENLQYVKNRMLHSAYMEEVKAMMKAFRIVEGDKSVATDKMDLDKHLQNSALMSNEFLTKHQPVHFDADIMLLSGIAKNIKSGTIYFAPCLIENAQSREGITFYTSDDDASRIQKECHENTGSVQYTSPATKSIRAVIVCDKDRNIADVLDKMEPYMKYDRNFNAWIPNDIAKLENYGAGRWFGVVAGSGRNEVDIVNIRTPIVINNGLDMYRRKKQVQSNSDPAGSHME